MIKLPSYLHLTRYGIFHFRIRLSRPIAVQLGTTEFKRSLYTSNRREAIQRARILKIRLDNFLKVIRERKMKVKEARKLLDKVAEDTIQGFRDRLEDEDPADIGYELTDTELEDTAEWFRDLQGQGYTEYEDESGNTVKFEGLAKVQEIRDFADWVIKEYKVDIADKELEKFCRQVVKMLIRLREMKLNLSAEIYEQEYNVPESVKEHPISIHTLDTKATESVTLREIFEKYYYQKMELEEAWRPKTAYQKSERFKKIYEILQYFIGSEEIYLHEITNKHATRLKDTLLALPKYLRPNSENTPIAKVLSEKHKNTLSIRTVNNYIETIQSIFDYAKTHHYVENNPFIGLRIRLNKKKRKDSEYKPFTNSDLANIFELDVYKEKKFNKPYKYWLPIIALYTGARIEEICQLLLTDIIEIDGVHTITIVEERDKKRTKTEASNRVVPVHSKLIDIGLIDYVELLRAKQEERLFPETTIYTHKKTGETSYSHYPSRWFRERVFKQHLIQHEITDKKVFHSFRKTFVNALKQKGIEERKVKALVGHEDDTMTYGVYGEPYNTKLLKEIIEKVDYPEANLPWDCNPNYSKIRFPWK